jgi:hypothetical protein
MPPISVAPNKYSEACWKVQKVIFRKIGEIK